MQLPTEITVSIAKDPYLPEEKDADGKTTRERELFGDDFAGDIVLRWPSHGQLRVEIPTRLTGLIESYGARDPSAIPLVAYRLAQAFIFFEVLGKDVPPWLKSAAAFSPKAEAAIMHAYQTACARIEETKKNSAGGSPSSSLGT